MSRAYDRGIRWLVVLALLIAAAASLAAGASSRPQPGPSGRTVAVACSDPSQSGPVAEADDPDTMRLGSRFIWVFAKHPHGDGAYGGAFRWKLPVLVANGHSAMVRIGAAMARSAGLQFAHGTWRLDASANRVIFRACPRSRAAHFSFFSGGLVASKSPACIPVEIRLDRGAVRQRVIFVGGARCFEPARR
jgi:hypothetical protein